MPPTLYHNALSPPSRAALLTVRNLGLDIEVKAIDTYKGEQNTPEYLKINPLHQVPVYVDEDFTLTESRAIAVYLASSAKSKLYPTDLKKRALVDSRLYFDATNSFPVIRDFAVSLKNKSQNKAINIIFLSVPCCVPESKKSHKTDVKL
jgi:glutathione S-transferase